MPELPDIVVYMEALQSRIVGHTLRGFRISHPFLLRSVQPPVEAAVGKKITELRRLGKRIAFGLDEDIWLVLHLMIAGRLHWRDRGLKINRRVDLAVFEVGVECKQNLSLAKGAVGVE